MTVRQLLAFALISVVLWVLIGRSGVAACEAVSR